MGLGGTLRRIGWANHVLLKVLVQQGPQQAVGGTADGRGLHRHMGAVGLLRDTGRVLLDAQMDAPVVDEVREVIEHGPWPARLADLHVWQVGRGKFAVVASVVTTAELDADRIREALSIHDELVHVTVEVHRVDAPTAV